MTDKEKELLQTLYVFYSEDAGTDFGEGDEITYNRVGSKHHGKVGTYKGVRDDGKVKLKLDNIILYADPSSVKKIGKPKNIERLFRILDQMVADGDLSVSAKDQFIKEANLKTKQKTIDPYGEENWEEEVALDILKNLPKRGGMGKVRHGGDAVERLVRRSNGGC